jgi:hypothetical protein
LTNTPRRITMKPKTVLILIFLALFLAACAGGPPNDLVIERIYQVYLYEAKVQGKVQCPIPPNLGDQGYQEIWKVAVKNTDKDSTGEVFFYLENGEWEIMLGMKVDC